MKKMTADLLSPSARMSQPLKKRKVELNDTETEDKRDVKVNIVECPDTTVVANHTVQENKEISESGISTIPVPENGNIKQDETTCYDETFVFVKMEQSISSEAENMSKLASENTSTPLMTIQKTEEPFQTPTHKIDIEGCKVECILNTPQTTAQSSVSNKDLNESPSKTSEKPSCDTLLTTPTSSKQRKHSLEEDNTEFTPSKQKKRKDIDALSSEICDDPSVDPLFIANEDETKDIQKTAQNDVKNTTDSNVEQITTTNCKRMGSVRSKDKVKQRFKSFLLEQEEKKDDETIEDISEKLNNFNESDGLSEHSLEKLLHLEVKLIHTVPPQHQITSSTGSKPLTQEEKDLFLQYGPLRSGTFSPMEDQVIRNNWENFCEIHRWHSKDARPFLYMRHGNKFYIRSNEERRKFVQFLANGLPWRTLYSVYHRFRKLYEERENNYNRYTKVEDNIILRHVDNARANGDDKHKNYSKLAKVLGRTKSSIWLRYKKLKRRQKENKKPLSKIEWTVPLINKFISTFLQITLSEDIKELKDATIPKPVWLKLEEKLNIDHNTLKNFWLLQLHMQLFCPRPIYLNDIKIQLIEYIYGKGISSTREIIWPNVAKYFEGVTTIFLCKIFFYLVRDITTKVDLENFPDIVEYLYHTKIPEIRDDVTDKYLPRLRYVNGSIEAIDEDTSNYTDAE